MALNIKNAEVERLATDVARISKTSKTEAIRVALTEHKARITALSPDTGREQRLLHFLETRVWPTLPPGPRHRWTRDEEDAALGYGEWGEPI